MSSPDFLCLAMDLLEWSSSSGLWSPKFSAVTHQILGTFKIEEERYRNDGTGYRAQCSMHPSDRSGLRNALGNP
jgi:hypothetical protein